MEHVAPPCKVLEGCATHGMMTLFAKWARVSYLVQGGAALRDAVEEEGNGARDEAAVRIPLGATRDGEGLAGAGLAIGEDGRIDALQRAQQQVLCQAVKHLPGVISGFSQTM